jgi:hypothetical protein
MKNENENKLYYYTILIYYEKKYLLLKALNKNVIF